MFAFKKMRFSESHVRSHARSRVRSHNHKSCDYGITIAFLFGRRSDKQVIVQIYLQSGKKPLNSIGEQEKNQCFYQFKELPSLVKEMR